jgi:hypothetical protein
MVDQLHDVRVTTDGLQDLDLLLHHTRRRLANTKAHTHTQ